ncbi:hypothetical protein ACLB2K_038802 [Fragaria x ananassa]
MAITTFPTVDKCSSNGRENHTVVADMDGTLLRGRSSFPYFALIAFEVGGILRLLFLLLVSPLAGLLYYFVSESAGIQVLIFATFAGVRVSEIESVARAVLPKFYSSDIHPESWRVLSACEKRCILTANPRIMVEAFCKDFLGFETVLGTEIATYKGKATGFVSPPGVLVAEKKADALTKAFGDVQPEIGLGDRLTDIPFMALCKFHGTTARGWKGMDPFYFFMNPSPEYEVTFLNKLPAELTCGAGKSSHEVANYIQRVIAASLSYDITSFTRKDKYRALAGNDGSVVEKPVLQPNKVMGC